MIRFEFDAAPWRAGLRALPAALDDELAVAVARGAEVVAFAARADHPYTDRTGRLTSSIRAEAPHGRFTTDTLGTEVVAATPYASFVEMGTSRARPYPYLGPAFASTGYRIEHHLHGALEAAVRRAGLGP